MNLKFYSMRNGLFLAFSIIGFIGFSQTYTFTTATATGNTGPTQVMIDAEYLATNLAGAVTVTGGIQYWNVPVTGVYTIETFGGQGYGPFGGRGAHMTGEFMLTAGTTLKILVGQQGGHYLDYPATTYNHQFGGGGGSFVTDVTNNPLIVAGGGGGNHGVAYSATCDAQITTTGAAGTNGSIVGAGGTNGNGGLQASSADGGGGLLGNGDGLAGGQAFVNGGLGGIDEGTGGFGCGGGTSSWNNYRGGGGGGYSGGGGANNAGNCCPTGGGGGSYNNGTNPVNIAGVQIGDGMIVITVACNPTTLTADVPLLIDVMDECSVTLPIVPTATNDCGVQVIGTPNVAFPITTQGTTLVVWTFDDGTNSMTQNQNIVIADITGPTPDSVTLADTTYDCSATSLDIPTATDNCMGLVIVTNDAVIPITTAGTNVVTWSYEDENGNITTQTQNIIINTVDAGATQTGALLTANTAGASYQWLNCDNSFAVIAGATNQSYSPTVTGNYAVQVDNGTCVDSSACFLVDFTGISELDNNAINIYPNPSKDGNFSVKFDGKIDQIVIFDEMGRSISLPIDLITGKVDGSTLANGKYIVRVTTNDMIYTKEIVIIK